MSITASEAVTRARAERKIGPRNGGTCASTNAPSAAGVRSQAGTSGVSMVMARQPLVGPVVKPNAFGGEAWKNHTARGAQGVRRASPAGTWGFGFWNDPFTLSLGMGGAARRTPCGPRAAVWFFHASPPNVFGFTTGPTSGWRAMTIDTPEVLPGS